MRIVIIAGNARSLIANRGDMIRALKDQGHEVVALVPEYDFLEEVESLGIEYHLLPLRRTGINPLRDVRGLRALVRLLRRLRSDAVFSYNIKPVVYGSLAAALAGVPRRFSMITGMGYLFSGETYRQRGLRSLASLLYRAALRYNDAVFFQNPDDRAMFESMGLLNGRARVVMTNGSGINLERFAFAEPVVEPLSFLLIGRLLQDKGIVEYVEAARALKARYPQVSFRLLGAHDANLPHALPGSVVDEWRQEGVVEYLGPTKDVRPYLSAASVYVLPSYREGTPRSVLEAMATGRPVVTTDAPGCRETVQEGVNGFLVPVKDSGALASAMERFILEPELIGSMGRESRRIAEEKYDVHEVNRVILEAMELDSPVKRGSEHPRARV